MVREQNRYILKLTSWYLFIYWCLLVSFFSYMNIWLSWSILKCGSCFLVNVCRICSAKHVLHSCYWKTPSRSMWHDLMTSGRKKRKQLLSKLRCSHGCCCGSASETFTLTDLSLLVEVNSLCCSQTEHR